MQPYELKIRTYKTHVHKALLWYTSEISNEFGNRIITPAVEHQMQQKLVDLQKKMCHTEINPVWRVGVELKCELGTNRFQVVTKNEKNVLYLDEFDF